MCCRYCFTSRTAYYVFLIVSTMCICIDVSQTILPPCPNPPPPPSPRCYMLCRNILPCEAEFRDQLSDSKAKKAADALRRASARLLVESVYRPARRQAAVAVANLASAPALCRSLLKSDPSSTSTKQGIVGALVTLAILGSKQEEREEIGTRRECIRALIGLAESRSARSMVRLRVCRGT